MPDGTLRERYVDFVYQPISDGAGQVSGIFVEGFDITDRMASVTELRKLEARLQELQSR
jgi:PAS domain-containing protein